MKGDRKTLVVSIVIAVTVSLTGGILLGYYALSAPNGDCEKVYIGLDDPLWPLIIHSWDAYENQHVARAAWNSLAVEKNNRLDAIVDGLSAAEYDDDAWLVGSGNKPDDQGETTLDAMIMDGETHDVGAVGGLRRVKNAIRAAHAVLKYTTHSLLVGDAATEFAIGMGIVETNLTIQAEIERYKRWIGEDCQPNFRKDVIPDPTTSCGPYTPAPERTSTGEGSELTEDNHDTIGIVVIDEEGQMAVGTSTNGLRHKIAGRVGDSPIPGAGSYVDKEVGACTATGDGDVMIRFLPCFHAVDLMRRGATAREAATAAMDRIDQYYTGYDGAMIVVYKDGTYGGACRGYTTFPFVYQHKGMSDPEVVTWICET